MSTVSDNNAPRHESIIPLCLLYSTGKWRLCILRRWYEKEPRDKTIIKKSWLTNNSDTLKCHFKNDLLMNSRSWQNLFVLLKIKQIFEFCTLFCTLYTSSQCSTAKRQTVTFTCLVQTASRQCLNVLFWFFGGFCLIVLKVTIFKKVIFYW